MEALEAYTAIYGEYDKKLAKVHHNLVKIYFENSDYVSAWNSYKKSLDI